MVTIFATLGQEPYKAGQSGCLWVAGLARHAGNTLTTPAQCKGLVFAPAQGWVQVTPVTAKVGYQKGRPRPLGSGSKPYAAAATKRLAPKVMPNGLRICLAFASCMSDYAGHAGRHASTHAIITVETLAAPSKQLKVSVPKPSQNPMWATARTRLNGRPMVYLLTALVELAGFEPASDNAAHALIHVRNLRHWQGSFSRLAACVPPPIPSFPFGSPFSVPQKV